MRKLKRLRPLYEQAVQEASKRTDREKNAFWAGFEKCAISKSTYIRARANAFRRLVQKHLASLSSASEREIWKRLNYGKDITRAQAVYLATRKALNDLKKKTKRSGRILRHPPDAANMGKNLRQREHARWLVLSNKINRKLNQEDLGLSGMGLDLPKSMKGK